MSYEFKKLSDVTLLDSVPSGATVLAEVDGAIRRVPGNGLGGSNSAGGYTVDYPETTYTFDGDLAGKEYLTLSAEGTTASFVRVGDCVDDNSRFIGKKFGIVKKNDLVFGFTTSSFTYDEDRGLYRYTGSSSYIDKLTIGAATLVRWDGTLYECEVQDGSAAFGEGTFAVGNGSGFDLSGSGEPFLLVFGSSGTTYYALNDTEAGKEHSASVFTDMEQTAEITADYIMDMGALFEGALPTCAIYTIGELTVLNALKDTEMGAFIAAVTDGEQIAPPQTVRQGLYLLYAETPESGDDLSDPVITQMWCSSIGVAAGTNTVELPEKLTEAKNSRLGGYWCNGVSLVWDGNTEGLEQLPETTMYRISEEPIPATMPVQAALVTETTAENGTVATEMQTVSAEGLTYAGDASNAIPGFQLVEDGVMALVTVYEDFLLSDATIQKGTYALCQDTETDGQKVHSYVYAVMVAPGWAKWPEQLGGYDKDRAQDYTILKSSTEGSSKKFKVTVDDSGTLTATEITE